MEDLAAAVANVGLDASTLETVLKLPEGSIPTVVVHGSEAIAAWRKLREIASQTKRWPVLFGSRHEISMLTELLEDDGVVSAADILERGHALAPDPAALATKRRAASLEAMKKHAKEHGYENPVLRMLEESATKRGNAPREYPNGPWPKTPKPLSNWSIPYDVLTRVPLPEVLVGLVPTETSWHVPAILRFGNWNECPPPEEHVALMKHWHERFGAELVGMTHDVVEMLVSRPPQDRAAAIELAKQQYDYCGDIVDQGVGSIEGLAAGLLKASVWYFWWD